MKISRFYLPLYLILFSAISAFGNSYWVYTAQYVGDKIPSTEEMISMAKSSGSFEFMEFSEDGVFRRSIIQFGQPGVGYPGFTSLSRVLLEQNVEKSYRVDSLDGTVTYKVQQAPITIEWKINKTKSYSGICEVKYFYKDTLVYTEIREETYTPEGVKPNWIRLDFNQGTIHRTILQVFEPCTPSKSTLTEYTAETTDGGTAKSSYITTSSKGDPAKAMETQPVQFTAPMKGLNLSFDSGWWPNGKDGEFEDQPGGFPVQVRIRAAAVANHQADIQGFFHLSDSWLTAGNAAGFWGYDFGAELYMKAGFDIGLLPPFVVDVPFVPDILLRSTVYDYFTTFLFDTQSVLQNETPKTHLFDVNLVDVILKLVGVTLPDWLKWIPFSAGAGLDASTKTDGSLECDTISLQEGLVFWTEGQSIPVEVGETGYRSIMNYNEICNLVLTVKFYPTVFISLFGARWDLPLLTIPWSPFNGPLDLEFRPCEINFTSEPPTQPPTDWFTEDFTVDNDLDYKRLLLTPANVPNRYIACTTSNVRNYPTDPQGGTVVSLPDDGSIEVPLTNGKQVKLYGVAYDRVFIGSNGYLTFTEGDTQNKESPENHFRLPRVSGLFDNLKPNEAGQISWKQLDDRFVVTYDNVKTDGNFTNDTVSFQIELFYDGRIAITWLLIEAFDGLAGISAGGGVPTGFKESDLTRYAPCFEPEGASEGTIEGDGEPEGEGIVEGSPEGEGVSEGEGEGEVLPDWCPQPCTIQSCGNSSISSNARNAWNAYCAYAGLNPLTTDLDNNQMNEVAQLQLLDIILANPGLDNRCCILSAWQSNFSMFTILIDNLISQGQIPQRVLQSINANLLKSLFAGLATIGEDSIINKLSTIGAQLSVPFAPDSINRSASQYLGAMGDADLDRVCNLAEYNATFDGTEGSLITFIVSAIDKTARNNGGGCGAPCFSDGTEGELLPEFKVVVTVEGNSAPASVQIQPESSPGLRPGYFYAGTNITVSVLYDDSKDAWQGWTVNGSFAGWNNPISLSVTDNMTITAMFIPRQPEGAVEGETRTIIPVVQPLILNLGSVAINDCIQGTLTLINSELSTDILNGIATISAPELPDGLFTILAGASYTLNPGMSQLITIRFCANNVQPGEHIGLLSISGGSNPLIIPVLVTVTTPVEGSAEGTTEGSGTSEGTVEEGQQEGQPAEGETVVYHTTDRNGNWRIELSELLRVIQFFNSWGYHCANPPSATEDGYVPGQGTDKTCKPHASDYNPQDWRIDLRELLRLIQFFNSGGYHIDPTGEDGFGVGAPS